MKTKTINKLSFQPAINLILNPNFINKDNYSFRVLCWWGALSHLARKYKRSLNIVNLNFKETDLLQNDIARLSNIWPTRFIITDSVEILEIEKSFIYISSSSALTKNILDKFPIIYICPNSEPDFFSPPLLMQTIDSWNTVLVKELGLVFPDQWSTELDTLESNLNRTLPSITAISSIYNGDTFLNGFLEDAARWEDYDKCEHLLIRAGSEGQEHERLIQHVNEHPNAVYINLAKDPGLYAVWNLGIGLSVAPYVTNANIDDRRAPQQVASLTSYLDDHAECSVVSTKLRVTRAPNMPWQDSQSQPLMFEYEPVGSYKVDRLFRYESKQSVSRNLPHCMPVWRRELHYQAGLFNEERYGPSADWEFWLRAGLLGIEFAFLEEPMGLYLQNESSYWHRDNDDSFDRRISDEYALLTRNVGEFSRESYPLRFRIAEALNAVESGDALLLLSGLVDCVLRGQRAYSDTDTAQLLIDKIALQDVGMDDFYGFVTSHQGGFVSMRRPLDNALTLVVEYLHASRFDPEASWLVIFEKALVDHYLVTRSVLPLVSLAFLYHKQEHFDAEQVLLASAYALSSVDFWAAITRVYRFEVSLDSLTQRFTHFSTRSSLAVAAFNKTKVWFYPVYASNKYTRLLFENIIEQDGLVVGITNLGQFEQLQPVSGYQNVIHIHWIKEFISHADGASADKKGVAFLAQLERLKEKGFKIRWTIHNRLSHQSVDQEREIVFRQALYDVADRVYLHHPMALDLIGWATDKGRKCSLVEHGHYLSLFKADYSREDARERLGFQKHDFILLYMGMLRDYKGLQDFLPVMKKVSEQYPHFKLMIAGKIYSAKVRQALAEMQCPNIIVHDEFLSDDEIECYTAAADMGFLSYRSILTSGALFHLLSGGLPVIAPRLGTIPAYVAQGWNGFLYEGEEDVEDVLLHCCRLPRENIEVMGEHALALATSLEWRYY